MPLNDDVVALIQFLYLLKSLVKTVDVTVDPSALRALNDLVKPGSERTLVVQLRTEAVQAVLDKVQVITRSIRDLEKRLEELHQTLESRKSAFSLILLFFPQHLLTPLADVL